MPYNLSNNEIIRNFEFEDVTKEGEEDFFKYNFSFDITDSKGTLILDYDGYIFEGDRDYELEWGQKKPEDWKKADTEILIDALEDWKNIKMAKGGGVGKTLAPKSDRIYGSEKNAKGSASSEKSASKISLSAKIIKALENKLEDFKKTNKTKKVSLNDLKAVYRRGLGAYSSSHRPTISGGKPNTRNAWAMARVNKFLLKAGGTKVKKAYVQDDDLLKMADGGGVDEGKWIVKYISTDDDDVASVWVIAENREDAIEQAEEDNWDIEEIISVEKGSMASGGKIGGGKGSEWAFWAGLLGLGVLSYIGINKK